MLSVSLDVSGLIETLTSMEEQLKNFPNEMGQELTEWQTEDMRRRYPNTTVTESSAETSIWPTSRLVEKNPQKIKTALKAHKQLRKPTVTFRGGGEGARARPILRPELYEKLAKRMDVLLSEKLSWR